MKKLKILLILVLAIKINIGYAQKGFDASFSPLNNLFLVHDDLLNEYAGGRYNEFKLGYFRFISAQAMLNLSFQYGTASNQLHTLEREINSFPNYKDIKTNYTLDTKSYIFRYEGIGFKNEIDFKSHIYIKSGLLIGYRNSVLVKNGIESVASSSSYSEKVNESTIQELPGISVIFGAEYGLGYQYNITKFIGVYGEANGGYILPATFFYNANIGIRYRVN